MADIFRVEPGCTECQSLETHIRSIAQGPKELMGALPSTMDSEGRVPLLNQISECADGKEVSMEVLKRRTGLPSDLQLTPADFAMWVFREIQARRIVEKLS
jgi:hypothetical protein